MNIYCSIFYYQNFTFVLAALDEVLKTKGFHFSIKYWILVWLPLSKWGKMFISCLQTWQKLGKSVEDEQIYSIKTPRSSYPHIIFSLFWIKLFFCSFLALVCGFGSLEAFLHLPVILTAGQVTTRSFLCSLHEHNGARMQLSKSTWLHPELLKTNDSSAHSEVKGTLS